MRIALAIALAFITTSAAADIAPPPRPEPERKVKKVKTKPPVTTLVGVFGQDGVERCLADWKSEWLNLYPVIGFTPLKPTIPLDEEGLLGKLVVAEGVVDPSGLGRMAPVKHEGPCAMAQMRSDWVNGPHGIRLMRPGMGTVSGAFVVKDLEPFDGLAVRLDGDEVVATLKNTFSTPLVDVRLHLHYEGCFGKPGTDVRTVEMPELAPGEEMTLRMPRVVVDPEGRSGRRTYRASSIQVQTDPTAIAFDLDWPLGRAGVESKCPDDEPGRE